MTEYRIRVHHCAVAGKPYQPGDQLTEVLSLPLDLPAGTTPVDDVADDVLRLFNVDLDLLDNGQATAAEARLFAVATAYRHLQLRSLSVGDVLRLSPAGGPTLWLARAPSGWAPISRPPDADRHYLTIGRLKESEDSDASFGERAGVIRILRVHELALDCGHLVTHIAEGLSPVSVSCCDRLGSGIGDDDHYWSFSSRVDFGRELADQVRHHPASSPEEPPHVLLRRARTDDPYISQWSPWFSHCGRFPARVGASTRRSDPDHTAILTAAPGC